MLLIAKQLKFRSLPKIQLTRSAGGVFQFRQEEFTANLIEITGSIYQGDSSAIIGGYATDYAVKGNIVESKWGNLNSAYIERLIIAGSLSNWADTTKEGIVAGNKVILNNEDPNDKKSTLCGIIGGKVQGSGSLTAKNNQIQVDGLVEYESWYVGEVIGAQVVEGFGVAENNTVSISNGSHRGDVIGAEGTNNTSQTTISSNAVNIVNATTYGYVYGGRIESLSAGASGVVLGNTVTFGISETPGSSVTPGVSVADGAIGGYYDGSLGKVEITKNQVFLNAGTKVNNYVYGGYIASTGAGNIIENKVTLTKATINGLGGVVGGYHLGQGDVRGNVVTLKDDTTVISYVVGGYSKGPSGNVTGNKVTVENSTVGGFEYKNEAGEVIGVLGYIYGGYIASSEGEGNITENVVTLTKTTLKGATGVVGGWHSGKGTVTGNHVNLHQSEINSFVIGGHTTGLGDVKENYVFADNTTVNGYVYGGFFNNSTNGGVAIGNQVTLTNVTVKGDGVAGGYNSGKGSEGNESSSTQRVAIGNTVKISNNDSTSNSVINLFVAGGLTGYYSDSPNFYWNINNNFVNLESTAGSLTVNGYVAGGFNQATGQANGNTVCINCIKATNSIRDSAETSKVTINQYVIGGYISGINASEDTKTSASNNTVIIKNNGGIISIGSYVGGGSSYTKGATESSGNSVTIKSENSRISIGSWVYGGLIGSGGTGAADYNTVTLENGDVLSQYVAGAVHQGTGSATYNKVFLTNTNVNGFVSGGLDWGDGQGPETGVTLDHNRVEMTGGQVTGRVVGARSVTKGSSVSDNSVKILNAKIKKDEAQNYKGHVLGGANQAGGNALKNVVLVENSTVDGYTDNNIITVNNSNVGSNIAAGYNQAGGKVEANNNHVTIVIDTATEGETYTFGGFVSGGIIGKEKLINQNDFWGSGSANLNTVTIDNLSVKNTLSIAGYVAGGYFDGAGTGSANINTVRIGTDSPSDTQIHIGYVLGGFVGAAKKDAAGKEVQTLGDTSDNQVFVNNTQIKLYVVGGYNRSSLGNAERNVIELNNVSLLDDSGEINEHFVAGGLIEQAGNGNAYKNTVQLTNSNIRVKYVAGGVSQGNGQVNENTVVLVDTAVQGLVVGGLDWGDKNVSLYGNKVSITGGLVKEVSGEELTGRVVGARSIGSGDVSLNFVQLQDVELVEGAVRGGVSAGGGSSLNNRVEILQSHIKKSVAGGYIEAHLPGEVGDVLGNSVLINDSSVDDNVEGGFNQVSGKGNASQNTVQINGTTKITGFVAGAVIGKQSEGNTDGNQVTITANAGSSIAIGGYVAGGFNDGKGHGAVGNIVWLEAASVSTSKLTVDNFVVGGYLRSGEGSTNGNTVVIKNAVVSGPYIAAGLNEGLGQAQNNSVILENADVTGGVTGGRVTAAQTSNRRSLNVANSNIGESSNNYSALVQNNTVNISGKTSVVGWVVGGESLAGNSVTDKPAYIQNNTVVIDDGYVEGRISGGAAVAGNVIGNKVFLNGGTIKGLVYGGTSAGDVKNNVVYLDGRKGIDVTGAWIYGRGRATTGTNGNTLNITNFKGAMQNIGNFDRIDLDLAGLMVREKEPIILLTENQSTNLDNSTIHIHSSRKAIAVTDDSSLADRYEVIKNQSGSLTAFNVVYEKDKLVVCEQGPMEGLYRVEWDGYPDQIGDSIDLVLERVWERPESGAYISNSLAWSRMHMRLHDRFGQAYYIDPFSGEERAAAGWVRQVGSHSHFRAGSDIKTHSRTAVTQIGTDLIRNEFNQDIKSVWGIFVGGLYNRSSAKTYNSAQSRSDGYALGVYGTLYTGNSPDDGFYVDSWLLFGHYNNKLWSDDLANFRYKSNGWVWSVESGYTFPLSQSGSKDFNKLIWTLQPEIQLVWDGVKADTTVDKDTGTRFKQLGTNNVSLRVGARLHANHMNKGLGFIEGNWIHNTKRAGVQMGTGCKYIKGGRNLAEFRAGLEGHVTKNLLGWATVGVQAGQYGYHNETAQIGLKYMF